MLTGGIQSTGNNDIAINNIIAHYTYINPVNDTGLLFRCVTGLGPSGNNNDELGELYFNGVRVPNGECNGSVIQPHGGIINNLVGVINVFICEGLTIVAEGVYTCAMRNNEMVNESVSVGVYYEERSKFLHILNCYHLVY